MTNEIKCALEAAYLAGFGVTGEGYNAEYPFYHYLNALDDPAWVKERDAYVAEALNAIKG